jgi:hypothetical protein
MSAESSTEEAVVETAEVTAAPESPAPGPDAVLPTKDSHAEAIAAAQAIADAASGLNPSPLSVGALSPAKKAAGKDSRQHQRAVVAWRARVLMPNNQFLEARVVDISEMGCGLECDRSFPVGSAITVLIAVPDLVHRAQHHILKFMTIVRFQVLKGGAVRMGVQLLNLDPAHQKMLAEWVARGNVRQ